MPACRWPCHPTALNLAAPYQYTCMLRGKCTAGSQRQGKGVQNPAEGHPTLNLASTPMCCAGCAPQVLPEQLAVVRRGAHAPGGRVGVLRRAHRRHLRAAVPAAAPNKHLSAEAPTPKSLFPCMGVLHRAHCRHMDLSDGTLDPHTLDITLWHATLCSLTSPACGIACRRALHAPQHKAGKLCTPRSLP